jgi:hypothetical protein
MAVRLGDDAGEVTESYSYKQVYGCMTFAQSLNRPTPAARWPARSRCRKPRSQASAAPINAPYPAPNSQNRSMTAQSPYAPSVIRNARGVTPMLPASAILQLVCRRDGGEGAPRRLRTKNEAIGARRPRAQSAANIAIRVGQRVGIRLTPEFSWYEAAGHPEFVVAVFRQAYTRSMPQQPTRRASRHGYDRIRSP